MTTVVTGRVVVPETGATPDGMRVIALGDWLLTTEKLGETRTKDGGQFRLEVDGVNGTPLVPSSFRVRVVDVVGRPVTKDLDVPGTVSAHDLGDVNVAAADMEGLLVTNLTGTPTLVSDGNAVRLLVDGREAFGRIAEDMSNAKFSVNIVELFFALPKDYDKAPEKEKPALVFTFGEPALVPLETHDPQTAVPRVHDDRPERLIITLGQANKTVNILLNEPKLGWPEAVFWLAVLTPLAAGLGAGGAAAIGALAGVGLAFFPLLLVAAVVVAFAEAVLIKLKLPGLTDVDEAQHYFGQANADAGTLTPRITVHGFAQPVPQNGVLHCKMVITDENRAVVVGSPFSQRYFDFANHQIEDPHRGSNTGDMVHDLSIAVVGPAVHDLADTFRLYWNEDLPDNEKLPDNPVTPDPVGGGDDPISKVQVVRTLSGRRFTELNDTSEKGILESYLRAFAVARDYIYLENQYFTDSVITDALCAALKAKPSLQLIVVVPIKPDVIFYPRRQAKRIDQLRDAGGDRVGVFTRWTYKHNVPDNARPWVAPVYIHAKGGVVDDSWAIVGSANLDGLSLDYNLLLSPLVFGETTAAELDLSVIPAETGKPTPFGQQMRRRLFAEHLGIVDVNGNPDRATAAWTHHRQGVGSPFGARSRKRRCGT